MSDATKVGDNEVALTDLATEIRTEHEAVRTAAETAAQHAIQCGQLLSRAKDGLVHGEWLPWLQEHCRLSERTAQAYMRLARKYGELDEANAQRVADLPVREAMKAIADERTVPPVSPPDDIWAWADRQVNGPFNTFDLDNLTCLENKVLTQTGVPPTAAFCLGVCDEDMPMLRLIPWREIGDALTCLAPIAKGKIADLDIDLVDLDDRAYGLFGSLPIVAQRYIGLLIDELEYRYKAYKSRDMEANWNAWRSEAGQAADAFTADTDARRERLLEEARAEGATA